MLRLHGQLGGLAHAVALGVQRVVVDALGNQNEVGEAEVDGQRDDGGDEAGPERAGEVGDVADEPDGEEGEGDAFGGGLAVVFDQLGDLGGFNIVSGLGFGIW